MILSSYPAFRMIFATSMTLDLAGYPVWPIANIGLNSFKRPHQTTASQVVLRFGADAQNPVIADTTPGVDEYDWYLHQRTDDITKQYFQVSHIADGSGNTFSGGIIVSLTSSGSTISGSPPYTEDILWRLWRDVTVWVKRRSDGAIQYINPSDTIVNAFIRVA